MDSFWKIFSPWWRWKWDSNRISDLVDGTIQNMTFPPPIAPVWCPANVKLGAAPTFVLRWLVDRSGPVECSLHYYQCSICGHSSCFSVGWCQDLMSLGLWSYHGAQYYVWTHCPVLSRDPQIHSRHEGFHSLQVECPRLISTPPRPHAILLRTSPLPEDCISQIWSYLAKLICVWGMYKRMCTVYKNEWLNRWSRVQDSSTRPKNVAPGRGRCCYVTSQMDKCATMLECYNETLL